MTKPSETLWEIEPHTKAKHEILRKYLGAWFPILGSKNARIVYIDGFCGPGKYIGGEEGSPIIALHEAIKQAILNLNLVFQHSDCVLPVVASRKRKLIQYLLLFNLAGFQVSWPYYFYQLALAFQTHHVAPPTGFF
ncbi:MAG: three-Cys-motif partner protein TcmP, partial [Anaerolineales bacterium]